MNKLRSNLKESFTNASHKITSASSNVDNLKIDIQENHIIHIEQLNLIIQNLGNNSKIDLIDMKDEVCVQIEQSRKML